VNDRPLACVMVSRPVQLPSCFTSGLVLSLVGGSFEELGEVAAGQAPLAQPMIFGWVPGLYM
jgi:hypothetical protein